MTRKRFVKLLMAEGASRNGAEELGGLYNLYGWDYDDAISDIFVRHFDYLTDWRAVELYGMRLLDTWVSPLTDEELALRMMPRRRRRT